MTITDTDKYNKERVHNWEVTIMNRVLKVYRQALVIPNDTSQCLVISDHCIIHV
jgi:hypothetical protein